jgi:hypothetical protein
LALEEVLQRNHTISTSTTTHLHQPSSSSPSQNSEKGGKYTGGSFGCESEPVDPALAPPTGFALTSGEPNPYMRILVSPYPTASFGLNGNGTPVSISQMRSLILLIFRGAGIHDKRPYRLKLATVRALYEAGIHSIIVLAFPTFISIITAIITIPFL